MRCNRPLPILLIDESGSLEEKFFLFLKFCPVMIPDNVFQLRPLHIALHVIQW